MGNLQRKPLNHRLCVKSNHTVLKIILSFLLMMLIIIPFVMEDMTVLGFVASMLFCGGFSIMGIVLFFSALKSRAKLAAGQYFIYVDMVTGKRIQKDDDADSYYLQFARNKFEKSVSKRTYESTHMGTQYYLVQLTNENQAYAAYPANEYYIDKSVQRNFRSF